MDLSIQRLRVFVTVADAGSISAAARKLFLSQPAVSAHVRALETSLSAQLLERMPTGTVLTPAGYALRDRAREMFAIMDRVDAEVQHAQGIADRNLVLAGTSTLGAYLLPKLLARFQHEHPTLRTELRVGNAEQVLQWVLDREVSFGLFAGPVTDEQLEITPLFEDPLVLVGWRGHPLSGRLVEPHLLRQERFILREIGSATRTEQDLSLEAWGVPAHLTWTMWSPEAARESVRAGLGLSLLSEHVVEEDLRTGSLVRIRVSPPPRPRTVSLARLATQPRGTLEHSFIRLITTLISWPGDSPAVPSPDAPSPSPSPPQRGDNDVHHTAEPPH